MLVTSEQELKYGDYSNLASIYLFLCMKLFMFLLPSFTVVYFCDVVEKIIKNERNLIFKGVKGLQEKSQLREKGKRNAPGEEYSKKLF